MGYFIYFFKHIFVHINRSDTLYIKAFFGRILIHLISIILENFINFINYKNVLYISNFLKSLSIILIIIIIFYREIENANKSVSLYADIEIRIFLQSYYFMAMLDSSYINTIILIMDLLFTLLSMHEYQKYHIQYNGILLIFYKIPNFIMLLISIKFPGLLPFIIIFLVIVIYNFKSTKIPQDFFIGIGFAILITLTIKCFDDGYYSSNSNRVDIILIILCNFLSSLTHWVDILNSCNINRIITKIFFNIFDIFIIVIIIYEYFQILYFCLIIFKLYPLESFLCSILYYCILGYFITYDIYDWEYFNMAHNILKGFFVIGIFNILININSIAYSNIINTIIWSISMSLFYIMCTKT